MSRTLEDELVHAHRAPVFFAFAHQLMDSVNDSARAPRVRKHVLQQFLEHFQIERTARQESLSRGGIAGNRGQRLIQLVRQRRRQLTHQGHAAEAGHLLALEAQVQVCFYLRGDVDRYTHQLADFAAIVPQIAAAGDVPACLRRPAGAAGTQPRTTGWSCAPAR